MSEKNESTTEGYIPGNKPTNDLRSSLVNNFGNRSDEVTGTTTGVIDANNANPQRSSFVSNFGNRSDAIATRASVVSQSTTAHKPFVLTDADMGEIEASTTTEGYIPGNKPNKNMRSSLVHNFGNRSDEVTGTTTTGITDTNANPRSSFVSNFGNRSDAIATRASVSQNTTTQEFRRSQLRDSAK